MAEKGKKKKNKFVPNSGDVEGSQHEPGSKKPSMKTASDVISRILWDDSLNREKFTVGYLDRFDGIVEKPFNSLDWNDPAVVDNYSLALPKHRIQYFKYNNRKVWDKTSRKDIMFGSTGSAIGIHEFMAAVDEEKSGFFDEYYIPAGDDPKSEKCDDVESLESVEEYDLANRANFFIAARITNEDTVKNLKEVTEYMQSRDELIGECCILPEMFHLTLCILKLDSPSDVVGAISAIKAVASKDLPLVSLELEGLDNFRQRVLYARVEKNDKLLDLREHLVKELDSCTITDKFSFVPHVTLAKLSRPVSRLRHSNYIDQYLYLKFEDNCFGSQVISDLYLCEMGASRQADGFYKCACEVSLTQESLEM